MAKPQWDNACTQVTTCALTGATAFFAGIPDAAVVANGPLWCYLYALRYLEKPCPSVNQSFYCAQPDENTIVYGTEERLREVLESVRQTSRPSVLLIQNSCSISLIGDDIAGIAREADMPCPVVCIDSGGLTGGFWEGYRAAAKAYFAEMPLKQRSIVKPRTVNLLGCTFGYYNSVNDIQELKRMLALAGYTVLACPGAGNSTEEIANMTEAELNIVIHGELGEDIAKQLKQEYGIPYLSLLPPYGVEGSLNWLKALGQVMWMSEASLLPVKQEACRLEHKIRTTTLDLQRIWGDLWFEKTLIVASASTALGIAQALRQEWADTGFLTTVGYGGRQPAVAVSLIDCMQEGEKNSEVITGQVAELTGGLLLASSNEVVMLEQQAVQRVVCQNICLPVYDELILTERPFIGLRGACHMNEQLWNKYIGVCQQGK